MVYWSGKLTLIRNIITIKAKMVQYRIEHQKKRTEIGTSLKSNFEDVKLCLNLYYG